MTPDPKSHGDGTALFAELARVVAALAAQDGLRSFSLPYPREAQRALDRAVLHCLDRGRTPPRSLPELLSWCREHPAGGPLFRVPAALVSPGATLIDPVGHMPTRTCLEVASSGPEGRVEQEAVRLLAELAAACGSVDAYERCRRFLANRPAIGQRDRFAGREPWSTAVWNRVRHLYEAVPEALLHRRTLALCGTCGLPALAAREKPRASAARGGPDPSAVRGAPDPSTGHRPGRWCESEDCPPDVPFRLVRDPGHTLLLRRSLRVFLALPGPTEHAALAALDRAGAGHELIPAGLGMYRVTGAGPRVCFLRADDRREPALLAARVAASPEALDGPVLVVTPGPRAERDGYRAAFTAALRDTPVRAVLTTPEDLVRRARTLRVTPDAPDCPDAPNPPSGTETDHA
ncbi:hypothetical protein [Streptomyces sp. NPDC001985]|uniref:pPIWI_RE_Y domain-containing protein n=1 Tax=Streptomyces sp. NPDC001985 TaxID=3154406 RepID=UPI003319253A